MATLQQMINFAPAIHSSVCKDSVKKRNGHVVRVSGSLSEQNDAIHQVKESPFKRTLLRGMQEPSPIQKAENDMMDYCSTLEGDEGYQCWEAYFEFEDMKKESIAEAEAGSETAKDDLVKMVRQSGGVKSLVENVHFVTKISKMRKDAVVPEHSTVNSHNLEEEEKRRPFPEPDGLPKSQKELEEEEKALMPDSSYTRLFRRLARGRSPAWYTPRPDHETD
ncbi:hypothetical protein SUGI_0501700 [Cryptomeria japonica]|uniref:CCG-binding protein 1 n=1 Tax=Cryptomeria japonica TaxID=3369 RepID=UPI002408EC1B|nr:CCG-binding protein 1 [Cryptomeria japonica]GLJ26162.1 hypothetical protein SUGI_0501700 [Cryptomeria japonica]